jgi:hypothetical protein
VLAKNLVLLGRQNLLPLLVGPGNCEVGHGS